MQRFAARLTIYNFWNKLETEFSTSDLDDYVAFCNFMEVAVGIIKVYLSF